MCGQNGEPGVLAARNATMVSSGEIEPVLHQRQNALVMLLKTEYVTLKPAQVGNNNKPHSFLHYIYLTLQTHKSFHFLLHSGCARGRTRCNSNI